MNVQLSETVFRAALLQPTETGVDGKIIVHFPAETDPALKSKYLEAADPGAVVVDANGNAQIAPFPAAAAADHYLDGTGAYTIPVVAAVEASAVQAGTLGDAVLAAATTQTGAATFGSLIKAEADAAILSKLDFTGSTATYLSGNGTFSAVSATNQTGVATFGSVIKTEPGSAMLDKIDLTGHPSTFLRGDGLFTTVSASAIGEGTLQSNVQASATSQVGAVTYGSILRAKPDSTDIESTQFTGDVGVFLNGAGALSTVPAASVASGSLGEAVLAAATTQTGAATHGSLIKAAAGVGLLAKIDLSGNASTFLDGGGAFSTVPQLSGINWTGDATAIVLSDGNNSAMAAQAKKTITAGGLNFVSEDVFGATVSGVVPLQVSPDGELGTILSSIRFKQNVVPENIQTRADKLELLEPVSFEYKSNPGVTCRGLIAESVQRVYPEHVVMDRKKEVHTVNYLGLIPELICGFKASRKRLRELEDLFQSKY